jgi:hypothetical protein
MLFMRTLSPCKSEILRFAQNNNLSDITHMYFFSFPEISSGLPHNLLPTDIEPKITGWITDHPFSDRGFWISAGKSGISGGIHLRTFFSNT